MNTTTNMVDSTSDEFHRYKELLLSEITKLNESVIVLDTRLRDMQLEQAIQRTKSNAMSGMISVVISTTVAVGVVLLQKILH